MPVVQIHILDHHSAGEKKKLAMEMTKAITSSLKVPKEWVNIIISEMKPENNAVGGILIKDMPKAKKKKG
jgi:4-oxalocrotonate tautomerase family enzyme